MPDVRRVDSAEEVLEIACAHAGIFTWDIASNLLYADSALAEIYGFDPAEAATGQPIEMFLERVHPDDRPRLAKMIGQGIMRDVPQQVTYRVPDRNGH